MLRRSTGTAFADGVVGWSGEYRAGRGTPVSGDVDGDGRDDVISLYDNGNGDAAVVVSTAANGFAPQEWADGFGAATAVPSVGDYDLAVVQAEATTRLWTLSSTGHAFADPVLGWEEVTGGKPLRYLP